MRTILIKNVLTIQPRMIILVYANVSFYVSILLDITVCFSVLETCTISLLPLGSASEIGKKKKFSALFDIVYFSNRYVHDHN